MDKKSLSDVIASINNSLVYFKKGGWIDCKRTPYEQERNFVDSLEEFVEARFNRECFDIPELAELCEILDGRVFKCVLEGADDFKKKYRKATITLIDPEEIDNPSQELIDMIEEVRKFLGGNKIKFNGVRIKIKYTITNE